MEKLEKVEGKFYTQNVDDLPIEERVFFTEGLVKNRSDYRLATDIEVANHDEYIRQQEEKMKEEVKL
ncbi:MAG: hypothetical protein E7090_04055 [Bacteroidales bacterium]|nr:hypothetical protein [Bacteroidales bacterium]